MRDPSRQDGFVDIAFSGLITGAISGAVAASLLGVWGQVGVNALISGGCYIVNNYNNFNIGDFLFNAALGGLAGFVGGDGWTKAGSTLAYDLAFNGIKGSFMMFCSIVLAIVTIFLTNEVTNTIISTYFMITIIDLIFTGIINTIYERH